LRQNPARIPELLDRLELPVAITEKSVSELSGGERQRIALISALLLDRAILLLDEASSALDQTAKHAVIDLLTESQNLTILSVYHDRDWFVPGRGVYYPFEASGLILISTLRFI
jgi:putative ABC transport system ATP-binding protein